MSYADEVRDTLRAELRATDHDVPDELLDLYTLLALVKGPHTTWGDVHDAWSIWTRSTRPQHRSLVPFRELDHEVQVLDMPYCLAIRAASDKYEQTVTW